MDRYYRTTRRDSRSLVHLLEYVSRERLSHYGFLALTAYLEFIPALNRRFINRLVQVLMIIILLILLAAYVLIVFIIMSK